VEVPKTGLLIFADEPKGKEQAEPWRFAFGVEYMAPGLGEIYAATGARWTKNAPKFFHWGAIEPEPPVNGKHTYDWDWPDMLIGEYQKAGFRHFHIYTTARNKWAMEKPKSLVRKIKPGTRTRPLKREHVRDYAEYIRSMVERYDGDGKDDMPGLLYPIRYWEIEAEWHSFYKGTTRQYLDLLAVANKAARQADPEAKIILVGFLLYNLFDGEPDQKEFERRLTNPLPPIRDPKLGPKIVGEIKELLRHPELFDAVEFHPLGDWTDVIGWTKFIRAEMKKNGYERPIWAGDSNYSISPMLLWGRPYYPYVDKQKGQILDFLKDLKAEGPRRDKAIRWLRAHQASFTAKKILCSFGEGLAGINQGNLEDLELKGTMLHRIIGSMEHLGLIDVKGHAPTTRKPSAWWARRTPGEPRPVYWTMKLLIEKLSPYTATTRLSLGKGIYGWRCHKPLPATHKPSSSVFIWYENGKGELPGDPEPQVNVSVPTQSTSARLIRIITEPDKRTATVEPIAVKDGKIVLSVGETPLLIEE